MLIASISNCETPLRQDFLESLKSDVLKLLSTAGAQASFEFAHHASLHLICC